MEKIWANRLIAGTKTWGEVPASRIDDVKVELVARVESGTITPERYSEITGEEYRTSVTDTKA